MRIRIKRIYDPIAENDGFRVLVDRLWPRGVKKADARLDLWAKDLAPSPELRKWFAHEQSKFPVFQRRYRAELDANQAAIRELTQKAGERPITLLFAARNLHCNHTVVLRAYLAER